MAIDAVLFDIGNVLTVWDPFLALGAEHVGEGGITKAEMEEFFEAVDWANLVEAWDAGASHGEIRARVAAVDAQPHNADRATDYLRIYNLYQQNFHLAIKNIIPEQEQLVRDLQAAGVKTYALTNWAFDDIDVAKQTIRAVGLMQGLVVSGEEKVTKPNPRIYQIALERFGLDPERTVFVDDKPENIAAASALGIKGFVYPAPFAQSSPLFRDFLRSLGVNV